MKSVTIDFSSVTGSHLLIIHEGFCRDTLRDVSSFSVFHRLDGLSFMFYQLYLTRLLIATQYCT